MRLPDITSFIPPEKDILASKCAQMGKYWKNNTISGKNHCLRPDEGLLEAIFQALYDGERENMIKFESS